MKKDVSKKTESKVREYFEKLKHDTKRSSSRVRTDSK